MTDSRVLYESAVESMLEYISSHSTDPTIHIYLISLRDHIEAQTDALERIAGSCSWLDEAERIAGDALRHEVAS